jgi:hypothetical protein
MKISSFCVAAVLAASTALVNANKDETYYANGVVNPNIADQKMFWKEGYNVLEDLSEFDALYVTYHSCA